MNRTNRRQMPDVRLLSLRYLHVVQLTIREDASTAREVFTIDDEAVRLLERQTADALRAFAYCIDKFVGTPLFSASQLEDLFGSCVERDSFVFTRIRQHDAVLNNGGHAQQLRVPELAQLNLAYLQALQSAANEDPAKASYVFSCDRDTASIVAIQSYERLHNFSDAIDRFVARPLFSGSHHADLLTYPPELRQVLASVRHSERGIVATGRIGAGAIGKRSTNGARWSSYEH